MESPTKAPTTDSSSTGEPAQSCIIPDGYVDASIPPESQIAAPTPAGLGIYLSNLQVRHQSSMIKAHVMDVDSPLQAETLAVQLATQVLKALQQQQYKLFSDCQLLVDTLKKRDPLQQPAHWKLRP